ncbi:MAG: IS66 family transposase [Acidobacteria bacterium]|nr:IS66 family transposase [Acidobacteriota bacterium]
MKPVIEFIDMDREELNQLVERAHASLSEGDYRKVKGMAEALTYLSDLVADQQTTIRDLRELMFPASTEKTEAVLKQAGVEPTPKPSSDKAGAEKPKAQKQTAGHGRNGAEEYRNAPRVQVAHASLKHGDRCPGCQKGKVYEQQEPWRLVRIVGQAPLAATVYELQTLRCNLCGEIYGADVPEGVGEDKYDDSAAAMIAQLKYGTGMPFYRLEHLENNLGIPLPASTQWEIVEEAAELIKPARDELIRQAAQGEVLHNDDTSMKVLSLRRAIIEEAGERTGIFTSGVLSTREGRKIALFFTGRQHAGENLADVLKRRAAELPMPIQMSDALSRNAPKPIKLLVGNCLAHGRRQFVQITPNFPEQCRHVLETLGEVYHNDQLARERGSSRIERLHFHQEHSKPVMDELHRWLDTQLKQNKVEPNSGLGKAISYMLRHWQALTLFLREPGAPLDNNLVERALKKAILHRKNSLFYKTLNGAEVGDLYMSLIHTCELNDVNPFDYLTELQRHSEELGAKPAEWMPWSYRDSLVRPAC